MAEPTPEKVSEAPNNFAVLGDVLRRFENTVAHIVLNHEGVVVSWQPAATALLGWTAEDAVGRKLTEFCIPPPLRPLHEAGLGRWQGAQRTLIACKRLRTEAMHKNGHKVQIYVDAQVVEDGDSIRFVGWVTAAEPEDPTPYDA